MTKFTALFGDVAPPPPPAGSEAPDELRRWPGDFGSLALVSIDEDFFVLARVAVPHVRLLLSDVTAATEWPLARSVLETLELDMPDEDDDQEPAGDLGIVADLGLPAMDMGALLDDEEDRRSWREALTRLIDLEGLHGLVAGRACRLLLDEGILDSAEATRRMRLALSPGAEPAAGAAWVEGFLRDSGTILLHDEALFAAIDG